MPINDILTHKKLPSLRLRFAEATKMAGADECWEWTAAKDPAGYGQIGVGYASYKAHRVAWVLAHGAIPPGSATRSLCVCHTCDNRGCVNPAHLFLGTDADNAADMVRKGRSVRGEQHYSARRTKLTVEQVAAICTDRRPVRVIAEQYGVSTATIYGIQDRSTWKYLAAEPLTSERLKSPRQLGYRITRKTKVPDDVIIAIRNSTETYSILAARYGWSTATIRSVRIGRVGHHIPLGPVTHRQRGRPEAAIKVTFKQLRGLVSVLMSSIEEMDEGWFVPAVAMQALLDVWKAPSD